MRGTGQTLADLAADDTDYKAQIAKAESQADKVALVRRERLMLDDGSMHQALYTAITGGQIPLTR